MSKKILLTGATGYVGGTILSTLLSTEDPAIRGSLISVLVRDEDQARVLEKKDVRVFLFQGFDDDDAIRQVATEHDVVIHTASGFHTGCARSLISGLADRKKRLGSEVFYLHVSQSSPISRLSQNIQSLQTSGTSSLADSPVLNLYPSHPQMLFSDNDPAHIVTTLKVLENAVPYPQRTTDLAVLSLGEETGVKTHIFYLPILYGVGTGDFNTISGQIPALMKATLRDGYTSIVGNGQGRKSHVHIEDVGSFYESILGQLLADKSVPFGKEGIFFLSTGYQSYQEISNGVARAATELKLTKNEGLTSLTIGEAVEKLNWSQSEMVIELAFVSSIQTTADRGKMFGWRPQYQDAHFEAHFHEVWKAVLLNIKTNQE